MREGRPAGGKVQGTSPAYLAKCALHATQEISLLQPIVVAADVMDLKPETLNLFKVKVHCKQFRVYWVYAGTDHLCPVHLKGKRETPQGLGLLLLTFKQVNLVVHPLVPNYKYPPGSH